MGNLENAKESEKEFRYRIEVLPSLYLGVPLDASFFRSIAVWDGVEEKLHKVGFVKRVV